MWRLEEVFVTVPEKVVLQELKSLSRGASKSPATAPEKVLDKCRSHVRWETPRGRYDECSNKFSLREETNVIKPVGHETAPTQHNQETLPQHNSESVNLTGLLKTKS